MVVIMIYLRWRKKVQEYIQNNFQNSDNWESWVVWRDYFIDNKSPELAASEAHSLHVGS